MNNTATTKTPQEVEQLLKASWKIGIFQFIGTYDPQPDGVRAFFKNLKTIQGTPLLFPEGLDNQISGKPARVSIYANDKLIKGKEYTFQAVVNNRQNSLLKHPLYVEYRFVTPTYESQNSLRTKAIDCENYINELQKDYDDIKGIGKITMNGAIRRLTSETNKKPETFIFELLQNADDYPDPKNDGHVDVVFRISEDYLFLSHNGLPFQKNNVLALCSVAAGDKEQDINKTGFKGMGFKSIFKHSNYVLVKSGGFQFRFDEQYHLSKGNKTFWHVIPIWTNIKDVDSQISFEFNQPSNVSFYIKPTEGLSRLKEYEEIFKRIFIDEKVLLFLRSIRSLKFKGLSSEFEKQNFSNDWCISELNKVLIPIEIQQEINSKIGIDDRIPEKYRDISSSLISFATKVTAGKVTPTEDTRLYAYLPTDLNFGFPFLINGDFIPDGSRDKLFDDIDWNLFLFEEAGYQLLLWLKEIYTRKQDFGYLELIPNIDNLIEEERDNSKITFLKKFKQGFLRGLNEVAFIPSFTGKLEILANIIVDKTGFIDLVGVLFFKNITGLEGNPIIWQLDNNKIIRNLIGDYDIGQIFGVDDLINLITEGGLNEWLMIPANNIKFFQKLVKNQTTAEKFKTLNIFLNQDGELKTAQELYWSVEDDLRYIDWLEPQHLMPEIRQALEANEHFKTCFKAFEFKKYVLERILPETLKDDIDAKLDDKETCLKFYRFMFKNRNSIDNPLKNGLKWFCGLGKNTSIETFQLQNIFFSNPTIDVIAQKGWLPESAFSVLSDDFAETDDDAEEWKLFWKEKFDVKEYEPESFIGTIILNTAPANKVAIVKHIADKNHNLNFYRYIFTHQDVISANRKALLKSFPVWSYEDFSVINSFNYNNLYLPDVGLLDVYEREIIPNSLYHIISDDFCESVTESAQWRLFWKTHFDIKEYEVGSFVNTIILDNQVAITNHQIKDSTNSIKFWSYLLDNEKFISNQKQLSNFHVFIKHEEGDNRWFNQVSNCYLSDEYNENGIESLVKEFKPNDAVFISPAYLGVNTSQKWSKFFIKCEIKHDESGLILNDLLPILSGRTQATSVKDIQLLFKFSEIIEKNNQWSALKNVNVLTKEGLYFTIQSCFIGDFYTGLSIANDVLPSIHYNFQVSDAYLTNESDREKWLAFWKKFVPLNNILDDRDRIIDFKIRLLLLVQDTEGYRAEHFEHFNDLSDLYQTVKEVEQNDESGKIVELRTKLNGWKLNVKGNTTSVSPTWAGKPLVPTMCLPSVYNPAFDFESLGVADLVTIPFVSEAYQSLPNAKEFIQYLGVSDSIYSHLKVLENPKAAHRFWELCLNGIYGKLFIKKQITPFLVCIPCGNTCKTPAEVYSLDIAEYVLDKSKLPSVDLQSIDIDGKNLEKFLEFQCELSFLDCLDFLKTKTEYNKEQFEKVVGWLEQYKPNLNKLTSNLSIQDFRQNGKWLNSHDRWVDINSLLYFDALPYEIRSLFNANSHRIKFPQSTERIDEQKICTWLGVDILTVDDFDINVDDKRPDTDFVNILNDRLELICFYVFGSNWAQKTNEYRLKLSEWSFFRCSEITQTYNKVDKGISLSMSAFKIKVFEDTKEVCYVNSWNHRKTFLDVINAVGKILKFKEDLRDFFEDNRYDVVDMLENKGLNVPEEWKRPKSSATNTTFTNRGFSTSNQAESSASHIPNNGTHTSRIQEPEEPKVYDPKIEQILRGLDGLNKNSQYSINRQTSGDALVWLEENGWNIENASAEFGILKGIAKDGYAYSIIVRSAKTGLLRLDQYNWNNLGLENYKLIVQTGGLLSDFILYDTQTELLNAPHNNQSVIVKQNTKQPSILTNMVEGLRDDDKATLYFITSEKGASIFNTLTGLKSQSDQESGSAPDSEL